MFLCIGESVGVGRFLNWASVDARGTARGLLLFGITDLGEFGDIQRKEEMPLDSQRYEEIFRGDRGAGAEGYPTGWRTTSLPSHNLLSSLVSDHSPIVLEAGVSLQAKAPSFENMWLKIDGFKDLVRSWWNGYSVEGYSSHCIAEKLKALKKDLKKWNKEVVGNVSFNRAEAFSRLQQWEAKENENALTPEDLEAKNLDLEEYKKWALLKKLLGDRSQEKSG
ncbi:hypothetical protein CK203_091169 [Vitis vinifera]|uniref:Uncharacterized protein n=1 Tax=Vitis vinifera TaxID=29760 RepID=A0A438EZ94_VITVI|nr:hypothetical protein CK203_091169 [Vitis vinifera]